MAIIALYAKKVYRLEKNTPLLVVTDVTNITHDLW